MADKGIGFNRTIFLSWLEAAASTRVQCDDIRTMRERLAEVVGRDLKGTDARRKTIDVLVNIWHKSASIDNDLHRQALAFFSGTPTDEHIWLHFGLTLIYFPFFRQTTNVIGQFARTGEPVTRLAVKNRLASELGHLGSLNRAAERVVASLVDWQAIEHQKKGNIYIPQLQSFKTGNPELQNWLLACALFAHPAEKLPFPDLIRLPEIFPFRVTVTIDGLRSNKLFNVQRQGVWDMVGVHSISKFV